MTASRELVLASRSPYRAELADQLCRALNVTLQLHPADVDERAIEAELGTADPTALAVALARTKAQTVCSALDARRHEDPERFESEDTIVIGGDQLLVTTQDHTAVLLHQPGTVDRAIEQLCSLSGTTHLLVNGVVAIRAGDHTDVDTTDIYRITMRRFSRVEAIEYVNHYLPLDCVGSYRIEDDAGLIESVNGEDRSGVIGFPLPAVARLLSHLGWHDAPATALGLSQSMQ